MSSLNWIEVADRLLVLREQLDEARHAALAVEGALLAGAQVAEDHLDVAVEVAELAEAVGQDLEVDLDVEKISGSGWKVTRVPRRSEGPTVSTAVTGSPRSKRTVWALPSRQMSRVSRVAEGVDDGHADAVQAAGDLVRAVVELAAGVQDREDDDRGVDGLAADLHRAGRDAAAVVLDRDRVVGVDERPRSRRSGLREPRRSSCRRPRRPSCGGRSRRWCRRCTCPAACARPPGPRAPRSSRRCSLQRLASWRSQTWIAWAHNAAKSRRKRRGEATMDGVSRPSSTCRNSPEFAPQSGDQGRFAGGSSEPLSATRCGRRGPRCSGNLGPPRGR
jgi:hypothetical protein